MCTLVASTNLDRSELACRSPSLLLRLRDEHARETAERSFSSSELRQLSMPTRGWLDLTITQPFTGCLRGRARESNTMATPWQHKQQELNNSNNYMLNKIIANWNMKGNRNII